MPLSALCVEDGPSGGHEGHSSPAAWGSLAAGLRNPERGVHGGEILSGKGPAEAPALGKLNGFWSSRTHSREGGGYLGQRGRTWPYQLHEFCGPREAAGQIIQHNRIYTENIRLALECASTLTSRRKSAQPPASSCHTNTSRSPGPTLSLGLAVGVPGLERRQVVIVPGIHMTFPKRTQPFCRHDLVCGPCGGQGGQECTSHGRLQHRRPGARLQPRKAATGPVHVKLLS